MSYVGRNLNLPLFLQTRKRFKTKNLNYVQNYMLKLRYLYLDECKTDTAASLKIKKIVNFHPKNSFNNAVSCRRICTFGKRAETQKELFNIGPGQYDTFGIPYAKKQGDLGSYWRKRTLKKHNLKSDFRKNKKEKKPSFCCDASQLMLLKMKKKCKKHAGIFLSNARKNRPTLRCMLTNTATCYRNPNEPGPTHYCPKHLELAETIAPVTNTPKLIPYLFYDQSNVPAARAYMFPKNIGYTASPGSFVTRYVKPSGVPRDHVFAPYLTWDLEQAKRNKFRLLPYQKFKKHKYYTPELTHIKGKGHTYLFKNIPPKRQYYYGDDIVKKKMAERTAQLYAGGIYKQMIKKPKRTLLSRREVPFPKRPIKITYNCLIAKRRRKTLKGNKKIGFLSSCERFKDTKRPQLLTVSQLKEITSRLPIERRITDYPITTRNIEEIEGRLYDIPLKFHEPKGERKVRFKFHPIPGTEIIEMREDIDEYFNKALNELSENSHANIKDFLIGDEEHKRFIMEEILKNAQDRINKRKESKFSRKEYSSIRTESRRSSKRLSFF